ncbi:hypothetical protein F3Y22_tig00112370pilonHSYRG00056 [Hibiscus syriacus]|uniref:Reverse transcriptase zinc-binding domain-containing protein n=1 Tax=Hibiscus syriacus TaxID=106335 RepID=A0A6A2XYZ1_HIBSY|nr:hypothetical protein F3Y22_tig00112370pilonHSYRG00056 [Hibiscus syriacus]
MQDRVIWLHDQAGSFSVGELTDLLTNDNLVAPAFDFDQIWKMKVPPKVRSILWMLKIERIPTKEFLATRGVKFDEAVHGMSDLFDLIVESDSQVALNWIGNATFVENKGDSRAPPPLSVRLVTSRHGSRVTGRGRVLSNQKINTTNSPLRFRVYGIRSDRVNLGERSAYCSDYTHRGEFVSKAFIYPTTSRPWRWWVIFNEIDSWPSQIPGVKFMHVPREGNSLADQLAKQGLLCSELFKAWNFGGNFRLLGPYFHGTTLCYLALKERWTKNSESVSDYTISKKALEPIPLMHTPSSTGSPITWLVVFLVQF